MLVTHYSHSLISQAFFLIWDVSCCKKKKQSANLCLCSCVDWLHDSDYTSTLTIHLACTRQPGENRNAAHVVGLGKYLPHVLLCKRRRVALALQPATRTAHRRRSHPS